MLPGTPSLTELPANYLAVSIAIPGQQDKAKPSKQGKEAIRVDQSGLPRRRDCDASPTLRSPLAYLQCLPSNSGTHKRPLQAFPRQCSPRQAELLDSCRFQLPFALQLVSGAPASYANTYQPGIEQLPQRKSAPK